MIKIFIKWWTLHAGEVFNFTTNQFDIIDADKPIYTAGRLGDTGAAGQYKTSDEDETILYGTNLKLDLNH